MFFCCTQLPEYGNVAEIYHSDLTVQFLLSKLEKRGSSEHPSKHFPFFHSLAAAAPTATSPSHPHLLHPNTYNSRSVLLIFWPIPLLLYVTKKPVPTLREVSFFSFSIHRVPFGRYLIFFHRPTAAGSRFYSRRLPLKILSRVLRATFLSCPYFLFSRIFLIFFFSSPKKIYFSAFLHPLKN